MSIILTTHEYSEILMYLQLIIFGKVFYKIHTSNSGMMEERESSSFIWVR
jgi:hypothetical protein